MHAFAWRGRQANAILFQTRHGCVLEIWKITPHLSVQPLMCRVDGVVDGMRVNGTSSVVNEQEDVSVGPPQVGVGEAVRVTPGSQIRRAPPPASGRWKAEVSSHRGKKDVAGDWEGGRPPARELQGPIEIAKRFRQIRCAGNVLC